MNCPLDYSLCDQTVTIYRLNGGKVSRHVVEDAYISLKAVVGINTEGENCGMPFLLILPGESVSVLPGDKVFQGIGPMVTEAMWPGFLPVTVPGLFLVEYVKPCYWMGELCHTEAGRS